MSSDADERLMKTGMIVSFKLTPYLKKNCANLFLLELCQIYTNFDNIQQKDDKEAKIMQGVLIFHLI